jgi:RHS repeat-associated protein
MIDYVGGGEIARRHMQTRCTWQLDNTTLTYPAGGQARPHAPTTVGGVARGSDQNGNLTDRGADQLGYDAMNRMVLHLSGGQTIARYTHDGDGNRTKRLDGNGTIHYIGRHYERNLGAGQGLPAVSTRYIYAKLGNQAERLIAFRRGGVLQFVGTDHLGSTVAVADIQMNRLDGARYLPYGATRPGYAGTDMLTDRKFTGQTEDAVAGLYWYASRAYDPTAGRFVQPDTIVPNLDDPQSLNRYAYCLNNPLRFTDPSGHFPFDGCGGAINFGSNFEVDLPGRRLSVAGGGSVSRVSTVSSKHAWSAATWETTGHVLQASDKDLASHPRIPSGSSFADGLWSAVGFSVSIIGNGESPA